MEDGRPPRQFLRKPESQMELIAGAALASLADRTSFSVLLRLLADPMMWAMIGFAAGIYFFFRGFAPLQRKRFIQDIPRSTIRGAALGLVEVSGKVEGPYTILAPLSEQDCFLLPGGCTAGRRTNCR